MLDRLTLRLLAAFAVAAALFLTVPELDLWLSGRFYDGRGFALAGEGALESFRNLVWNASTLTAAGAALLWLAWLPLGRRAAVPGRLWGWVAATYVAGPGLLVNALLKEHWGRARPAQVFDGEAAFTRPFVIAGECARNCSFVSGEAAAVTALAIVVGALAWPHLGPPGHRRLVLALAWLAGVTSLLRVATGRHFLSDVVFAAFFTAFTALALWHLMRVGPARDALSLPALRADLRALTAGAARRWRRLVG